MVRVGITGEEGGPGVVTNDMHSLHSLSYNNNNKTCTVYRHVCVDDCATNLFVNHFLLYWSTAAESHAFILSP